MVELVGRFVHILSTDIITTLITSYYICVFTRKCHILTCVTMQYRCTYCSICVLLISSFALTTLIGFQRLDKDVPAADRWFSYYWFHSGVTVFVFCITSLLHHILWRCDLYQVSPVFLLMCGPVTSVFFILGDFDRRINKSSDDSEYYSVLCTAVLIGLFVGLLLHTIHSFSSRRCRTMLPFLFTAVTASAFYFGREAYEDTDPYDYKGSVIPFIVTMCALLIICISIYIYR